jgi:hypothetical protein
LNAEALQAVPWFDPFARYFQVDPAGMMVVVWQIAFKYKTQAARVRHRDFMTGSLKEFSGKVIS